MIGADNQSDTTPSKLKGNRGSESKKKSLKKKRFSANLGGKSDLNPQNYSNFELNANKRDIKKFTLKAKSIHIEKVFSENKKNNFIRKPKSPKPLEDQRQSAQDYICSTAYQNEEDGR